MSSITRATVIWDNTSQTFPRNDYDCSNQDHQYLPFTLDNFGDPVLWSLAYDQPSIVLCGAEQGFWLSPLVSNEFMSCMTTTEFEKKFEANTDTLDFKLEPAVWSIETETIYSSLNGMLGTLVADNQGKSGRILSLNSRVGARGFLTSVKSLDNHLPPSFICHSERELAYELTRLKHIPLIAKPNFSMGGMGFSTFEGLVQSKGAKWKGQESGKKDILWDRHHQPILVETILGERETNRSITVDCCIDNSMHPIVGLSEQLLHNGFCYAGIKSIDEVNEGTSIDLIKDLSTKLTQSLSKLGVAGFVNFDFCETSDGRIALCDLNLRKSAPLGAHLLIRHLQNNFELEPSEYAFFPILLNSSLSIINWIKAIDAAGLLYNGVEGVAYCRLQVPDHGSSVIWNLVVGASYLDTEARLRDLVSP